MVFFLFFIYFPPPPPPPSYPLLFSLSLSVVAFKACMPILANGEGEGYAESIKTTALTLKIPPRSFLFQRRSLRMPVMIANIIIYKKLDHQSLIGLHAQSCTQPNCRPHSVSFYLIYRLYEGIIWSAQIDNISL